MESQNGIRGAELRTSENRRLESRHRLSSRPMRTLRARPALFGSILLACLAFLWSVSFVAADPTDADQNAIRGALERWTTDFNSRNSGAVCGLFANDLISNYQGQPQGNYDSLCARLKKSLSDPATSYHYQLNIQEIIVSGDLAVVRLIWTLTVHRKSASSDVRIEEPGLDVFRRQPDGTWKISRYMSYPVSP